MPTELYAHAPEILEHCDRIGKQYGLHDNALFHTRVTDLEWDDAASRWIVRTDRGDEFTAQFVAMGTGPLHVPKLPGIPGIESFEGHSFHTSRWDYAYTGGDPSGAPMDRLAGKRVAIIGTGATAVQCVPHLAQACGELFVFQRTPSSVDVRGNRPDGPAAGSRMSPRRAGSSAGWTTSSPTCRPRELPAEDLVNDGWTDLAKRIRGQAVGAALGAGQLRGPAGRFRGRRPREDERDPGQGRRDRRGPGDRRRRSRPGTASCASGRASTTTTSAPSTCRRSISSTPTAGEWSGSRPPAWSRPASSTRSTASSTHRASRSARSRPGATGSTPPGATASGCRSTGRPACAACTASTCTASRTPSLCSSARAATSSRTCRTT